MRNTPRLFFAASRHAQFYVSRSLRSKPIVCITNGTFYRQHPSSRSSRPDASSNLALFPNLSLEIQSFATPSQQWAILSPSSTIRTAFLQILRGQLICLPPTARSYPYLSSDDISQKNPNLRAPERAIGYVGFDVERKDSGDAYLSARYEARVDETDSTLAQYLTGLVGMNPGEELIKEKIPDEQVMRQIVKDLELERFFDKPVSTLSNGQSRRARIGKALLAKPEMLCLDAPFIGLDPFVSRHISRVLQRLAEANAPRIVLSLRPQDVIPDWITHVLYAGEDGKIASLGPKDEVFGYLKEEYKNIETSSIAQGGKGHELDPRLVELRQVGRHFSERGDFETSSTEGGGDAEPLFSRDGFEKHDRTPINIGDPIVEMEGVRIKYGTNAVLGDWQRTTPDSQKDGLWWTVRRGERWGIFGPNGSGKTTLISLVTSDHPQTYSAPVKLFGRSRLPSLGVPGITIFELQSRMGHASPEVHALFPKNLSVRRALESAWSDTPITKPRLNDDASKRVDACLRWFEAELNPRQQDGTVPPTDPAWASDSLFGELSFSAQRVALFLRATIRNPDIVILDEAFSGMDDLVRDKCLLFLSRGESMVLHYTDAGPQSLQSDAAKQEAVVVPGLLDHQVLLCISHSKQEVPGCIREWICLPESGSGGPRVGRFDGPVELGVERWNEIWGWPKQ
jgi:ABC-type molybdenum transport system ATPase subunit/photorepair protein PhrA